MKKYYKIKVGIEEFDVKEEDIPRIAEAMKTSNMVQLECGLFRGSAILAVCRDEKKESLYCSIDSPIIEKTPEQIAEINRLKEREQIIKEQISKCQICFGKGWKTIKKDGEFMATNCDCTFLKEEKQPEIKRISDELTNKFSVK